MAGAKLLATVEIFAGSGQCLRSLQIPCFLVRAHSCSQIELGRSVGIGASGRELRGSDFPLCPSRFPSAGRVREFPGALFAADVDWRIRG